MINGPGIGDGPPIGVVPEIASPKINFSPLKPEISQQIKPSEILSTSSERPKYEEPTQTMSPKDQDLADQFLSSIMSKVDDKKPEDIVYQVAKNISEQKDNPKGLADWIKSIVARFWSWLTTK